MKRFLAMGLLLLCLGATVPAQGITKAQAYRSCVKRFVVTTEYTQVRAAHICTRVVYGS